MPSKPPKYGIKFWLNIDVDTHYVLNISPYLGKEGDQVMTNLGAKVVWSFYTTLGGTLLLQGTYSLKNNFGWDNQEKSQRDAQRSSSPKHQEETCKIFSFSLHWRSGSHTSTCTCIFHPKEQSECPLTTTTKSTLPLRSQTWFTSTTQPKEGLIQSIKCVVCTPARPRWPMAVFYNMLNLAALNSYTLWFSLNGHLL